MSSATLQEACSRLGCSIGQVLELVAKGLLRATEDGDICLFSLVLYEANRNARNQA